MDKGEYFLNDLIEYHWQVQDLLSGLLSNLLSGLNIFNTQTSFQHVALSQIFEPDPLNNVTSKRDGPKCDIQIFYNFMPDAPIDSVIN